MSELSKFDILWGRVVCWWDELDETGWPESQNIEDKLDQAVEDMVRYVHELEAKVLTNGSMDDTMTSQSNHKDEE